MTVQTYDPLSYSIVIVGIAIPQEGYAEDEFIKIERDTAAFTDRIGTGGRVTRVRQFDGRATVTFSTMQGAEINGVLSALVKADQNAPNGAGVGTFALENVNGTTVHEAERAWISQLPDGSLGKDPTARAWKIRVEDLQSFEGI